MRKYDIWYDDVSASDLGIRMQGSMTISGAVPRVTTYQVPGRNGDLHISDGTFENREAVARCYVYDRTAVERVIGQINAWAFGEPGYRRLVSDEDTEHFLMARVANGGEVATRLKTLAPFEIVFDCMPQRFLTSGEDAVLFEESQTETVIAQGVAFADFGTSAAPYLYPEAVDAALPIERYRFRKAAEGVTWESDVTEAQSAADDEGNIAYYIGDDPVVIRAGGTAEKGYSIYRVGSSLYFEMHDKALMMETFSLTEEDFSVGSIDLLALDPLTHVLYNPTVFVSAPLYKLYGFGKATLTVNERSLETTLFGSEAAICYDAFTGAVYKENADGTATDWGRYSAFSEALTMQSGRNTITFTDKCERVEVIPRWWEL